MEAEKLTFRIGQTTLVDSLSLTVLPGEVVAIIGPNGAGKSTFLKMLSGDLPPTSGAILFDGQPLASIPRWELAQRRAVLPQSSAVPFDFTAREVVEMGRLPHRAGADNLPIITQAMERTDTAHLQDRIVGTLSGGERQRIHLARVLAQIWHPPPAGHRWLLLDEPTSSLDLAHQHSTLRVAREFSREGVGVLVVLHDLNLAAHYADRLFLLQDGLPVACDSPDKVLVPELIDRVFGIQTLYLPHPLTNRRVMLTV